MSIQIPPVARHNCEPLLPSRPGGYGSTGVADGTVTRCPACRRWWVSRPCYESYGPVDWWVPVRWWNRRLLRTIRQAEAIEAAQ